MPVSETAVAGAILERPSMQHPAWVAALEVHLRASGTPDDAIGEAVGELTMGYLRGGPVPFDPGPEVPRFRLAVLSLAELRAIEARAGDEPPMAPPGDSPERVAWKRWELKRNEGLVALSLRDVLLGGEVVTPEAFFDRVRAALGPKAANLIWLEVATHAVRINYLGADGGK